MGGEAWIVYLSEFYFSVSNHMKSPPADCLPWQRDTLHVDSEGISYPVMILMFLQEEVVKPILQFG